jgi:hypothetical protein
MNNCDVMPGECRASTSFFAAKTWMAGTTPGHDGAKYQHASIGVTILTPGSMMPPRLPISVAP